MASTSDDENVGGVGVDPVSSPASQPGLNPGNDGANADAVEIARLKEDMASVRHMLANLSNGLQNQASPRLPPHVAQGAVIAQRLRTPLPPQRPLL
jgi:hypothetical protein